jgi:hypothetical protein
MTTKPLLASLVVSSSAETFTKIVKLVGDATKAVTK